MCHRFHYMVLETLVLFVNYCEPLSKKNVDIINKITYMKIENKFIEKYIHI